jgi:hypothetical protein
MKDTPLAFGHEFLILTCTFSHLGTLESAKERLGKHIEPEVSEFVGTDAEHHSGSLTTTLVQDEGVTPLQVVRGFLEAKGLEGEYFTLRDTWGADIMTEEDL